MAAETPNTYPASVVTPNKHTQFAAARLGRRKQRGASGVRRYV